MAKRPSPWPEPPFDGQHDYTKISIGPGVFMWAKNKDPSLHLEPETTWLCRECIWALCCPAPKPGKKGCKSWTEIPPMPENRSLG